MAVYTIKSRAPTMTADMLDASEFEGSVSNLEYPSDLLSNGSSYGNSYTAFFISVHAEEELAKSVDLVSDSHYVKDRKSGAMATQSEKYGSGTVSSAMGTANTVGAFGGTYKMSSSPSNMRLAKAAGLGGVAFAATVTGGNNLEFKQQKACIILPTPNLDSAYNFSWESNSNIIMGGIVEGAGAVFNNPFKLSTFSKIGGAMGGALMVAGMQAPGGDTISRMSGYAPNPRKEQVFREPSFRQFSFTYTMAPRSEQEARNIEAIIRQFKYHAHPSLSSGDFCYRYPSEFDIVHYHNGSENLHLPKHATSVLESVDVNYAPNDNYAFFPNGMPSVIQLSLRFTEIAVITKEDIAKGY